MFEYYFWIWDKAIPKDVCESITSYADWSKAKSGTVNNGEEYKENHKIRKTEVLWAGPISVPGCLVQSYIREANKLAGWNFNLCELEPVQIGKYEVGSHYDWHPDLAKPKDGLQRKLSCTILLNDDFEGGQLEFENVDENPKLEQGSVIIFPSMIKHRVTPVTKGIRYSAVGWMTGPAFK
jgi:PKHD-type hydroxylase